MSRLLLTNCPNCAGELDSDGFCPYCKTKVRYANELDIQGDSSWIGGNPVEIAIKVKRGDETVVYPFEGYLSSMNVSYYTPYVLPNVELTFNGTLAAQR